MIFTIPEASNRDGGSARTLGAFALAGALVGAVTIALFNLFAIELSHSPTERASYQRRVELLEISYGRVRFRLVLFVFLA